MKTEATPKRKAICAPRPHLKAVIMIAVMIGVLPLADAAWDGNIAIQLGESFAAEFAGTAGAEVHRYYFYASAYTPYATILGATWKTTFGDLVTDVALFKADGTPVPLGTYLNAKTKTTIKGLPLTAAGLYYIQVKSTSGKGEYLIKTTAYFPSKVSLVTPVGTQTACASFTALGQATLAARVKANKGNTAIPSFSQLAGPDGHDVGLPDAPTPKPGKPAVLSTFKGVLLPANGAYALYAENKGAKSAIGGVTITGTITSPKARHTWYLGPVNPPTVILSVDNSSITEAGGVATFTATLSAVAGLPVTVDLAFSGTATNPADYTRSAAQIVIPAGSASGSIVVTAVQDALKESDETVVVDISAVANASENGVQQQTTSILDDDIAPQVALWQGSGHADASGPAFTHWDSAGVVPQDCARCHSGAGYQDFIGADGTRDNRFDGAFLTPGVFTVARADGSAAIGVIDCNACHNEAASELDAVVFPSDRPAAAARPNAVPPVAAKPAHPALAMDLGPEARCMQCHQGRESTNSVDEYIATKAPANDDTIVASLSFKNVHYLAAAATLYGGGARGAYQYRDGQADAHLYDGLNPHVPEANTCVECHNPHSLDVEVTSLCSQCHGRWVTNGGKATFAPVASAAELKDIRMAGSTEDYDGDGDTTEGMYYELSTMADVLITAIEAYATHQGAPIVYDPDVYPYFANATGGSYTFWTPRLLRAAYNYNYYIKEPGNYAHNPKYMVEILYDSIEDLVAGGVSVPEFATMHRSDVGHFDGQGEPFRHWDVAGATNNIDRGDVQASCAPCHSNGGFEFRQKYGIDTPVAMPAADGFECGTCHAGGDFGAAVPALKVFNAVTFPSPITAPVTISNSSPTPDTSFICMSCHRGRESMATLDADIDKQTTAGKAPRFLNVHYLPAGATLYGRDAKVAYMFGPSASYSGKWTHNGGTSSQCKYCHLPSHTFKPSLKRDTLACVCHVETNDVEAIRHISWLNTDYNGVPGDTLKQEVASFASALFAQMNTYAATHGLDPIIYDSNTYPYFLKALPNVGYSSWDATLVRAAFNYQYCQKEPGAWAHNTRFIMQVLYDSIDKLDDGTLNSSVSMLSRPTATTANP